MPDGTGGSGEGAGGGSTGMGTGSGGAARAGSGFAGTGSGLSGTGAGAAAAGVGGGGGGAGPTAAVKSATYSDAIGSVTTLGNGDVSWGDTGTFNWGEAAKAGLLSLFTGNPIMGLFRGAIAGSAGMQSAGSFGFDAAGNPTKGNSMADSTRGWGGSNISDALSIAAGINALTGGGGGSGSTTGDPFAPYRAGLASQYATALQPGGSTNIQDIPGFTQYKTGVLDPAMQQSQRTAAASGMLYSGNEQQELQKKGQQGYYGFMTDYLNRLATGSGASNNPLGGAQLASNQQSAQQQGVMQGLGALGQGISGISRLFGGNDPTSSYSPDTSWMYNPNATTTVMPNLTDSGIDPLLGWSI